MWKRWWKFYISAKHDEKDRDYRLTLFYSPDPDSNPVWDIDLQFKLFTSLCLVEVESNSWGESDLQFGLCTRLFSLFVSLNRVFGRRVTKWLHSQEWFKEGREIRISIHDGAVWWSFWMNPDEWEVNEPWGRRECFNFGDFFLGKYKHSAEVEAIGQTVIPMPERNYNCHYTQKTHTWKRPRWFAKRLTKFDMDMGDDPIPVPGKGENSYDCGDDAIYSSHIAAGNLAEAVGKVVSSALRDRMRYGWSYQQEELNARDGR